MSLVVKRIQDDKHLGELYGFQDYRAEDYGRFFLRQAIRGAVYKAATALVANFATASEEDEFGAELEKLRDPFTPADLLALWAAGPRFLLGIIALLLFLTLLVLILGALRVLLGALTTIARGKQAQPTYVLVQHSGDSESRRTGPTVFEGRLSAAAGVEEDDEEENEEEEQDKN